MASWPRHSIGLWKRVAVTERCQVLMQHLPVAAGAIGWVIFPSFLFMLGGKGNAFFYLTWENFSGSVSSLPQSVKRSAPGLCLRFTYTEFIALLNYRDTGRALWFVLCLLSSCGEYGELRLCLGPPAGRRGAARAASSAEHAKSGRLQASGVPWLSARDSGQPWLRHCVSPYQGGKTSGHSDYRN